MEKEPTDLQEVTRGCGKKRRVQSQGLVEGNVKRRKRVGPKAEEKEEVESSNEEGVESGNEEGAGSGNEEGVESSNEEGVESNEEPVSNEDEGVRERLASELCDKGKIL